MVLLLLTKTTLHEPCTVVLSQIPITDKYVVAIALRLQEVGVCASNVSPSGDMPGMCMHPCTCTHTLLTYLLTHIRTQASFPAVGKIACRKSLTAVGKYQLQYKIWGHILTTYVHNTCTHLTYKQQQERTTPRAS